MNVSKVKEKGESSLRFGSNDTHYVFKFDPKNGDLKNIKFTEKIDNIIISRIYKKEKKCSKSRYI